MLNQNNGAGLSAADIAAVMNSNDGFGNNGAWWLLILLFALGGGGWGNFNWGGMNGMGAMMGLGAMDNVMLWPYLMSQNLGNQMQDGFDFNQTNNRIDSLSNQMQSGFNGMQTNNKLDNIQSSLTNGFSNAELSNANRAMSQMQQQYQQTIDTMQNNFNAERALDNRLDSMEMAQQKCCCDNQLQTESLRATVLQENSQDRNQALLNTRDIIDNQNQGNQKILDKLCQLELDGVKQNYENRIANQQMNYEAQIRTLAGQNAALSLANQDARFDASQIRQTQDIENFVRPPINPSYPVPNPYGWNWYPFGNGNGWGNCNNPGGFYG